MVKHIYETRVSLDLYHSRSIIWRSSNRGRLDDGSLCKGLRIRVPSNDSGFKSFDIQHSTPVVYALRLTETSTGQQAMHSNPRAAPSVNPVASWSWCIAGSCRVIRRTNQPATIGITRFRSLYGLWRHLNPDQLVFPMPSPTRSASALQNDEKHTF